jgi:hypothetical protein
MMSCRQKKWMLRLFMMRKESGVVKRCSKLILMAEQNRFIILESEGGWSGVKELSTK